MSAKIKPLSEAEKRLLCNCAILSIAAQTGVHPDTVALDLDRIAAEGESVFRWDAESAFVIAAGHVLFGADRRWLQLNAHRRDPATN
jgi:hypothetical protein